MNAQTALAPIVEANPALVLLEPEKFDRFYEEVAREVRAHVPDLSTPAGRKAVASLAFKVTKTKTAIDDARKQLTEEARAQIKKVDEQGKVIRDRLDALRDEARKPLTDWEAAEEARAVRAKEVTDAIRRDAEVSIDDTSDTVAGRLDLVRSLELTEELFADSLVIVRELRRRAIETLEAAIIRLKREEADRAELARLRAAEEERQRQAEQDRIAAEAKAAEERAEREAAERAEAERKRIAEAAEAAQRAATEAAERAAEEARQAQARAHAEALAAEKRRADEAEAARKAEADRVAREEAKRAADAKAEADAQAARDADRAHRGKVMLAAKTAIMAHGIGEANAKAVVLAIVAGEVPAVSIKF